MVNRFCHTEVMMNRDEGNVVRGILYGMVISVVLWYAIYRVAIHFWK